MATAEIGVATDLSELDAMIARAERLQEIVERYTALVEAAAKRFAPVKTGALRDEIHSELAAMAGTVISDVPYSSAQEYGTAHQPGTAFMRPALEQYRDVFLREVAAVFSG